MISLDEVKIKASRKNSEKNNRLHFFASKFSIYFSWLFINLGMNANQVTVVFFITGLIGSICFLSQQIVFILLGYLLWRLHIIFDLCDGDVARFTQKFSINGAYWDYMIHSLLYPLFFININLALYLKYEQDLFMFIAAFGGVVVSQLLAVKNNYYRAMLFNKVPLQSNLGSNSQGNVKYFLFNSIKSLLSFEGFLLLYVVLSFLTENSYAFLCLMIFYSLVFLAVVSTKFISFTKKGYYNKRS